MSVRLFLVISVVWVVSSCDNDFFPKGYYDYQVARLLSGDSTKNWNQVITTQNCNDSVSLIISQQTDSLSFSMLTGGKNCSFDSLYLGKAKISTFSESLLSTDSIKFSTGVVWIIKTLSSQKLEILNSSQTTSYTASI